MAGLGRFRGDRVLINNYGMAMHDISTIMLCADYVLSLSHTKNTFSMNYQGGSFLQRPDAAVLVEVPTNKFCDVK